MRKIFSFLYLLFLSPALQNYALCNNRFDENLLNFSGTTTQNISFKSDSALQLADVIFKKESYHIHFATPTDKTDVYKFFLCTNLRSEDPEESMTCKPISECEYLESDLLLNMQSPRNTKLMIIL